MSEHEQPQDEQPEAEDIGKIGNPLAGETDAPVDASSGGTGGRPIEDLFAFDEDPVDFMSAESFPASDPPPPP